MSSFDAKKYDEAKAIAVKFFEKHKKLKTACLGEITFNSEGFLHLIWKKKDAKRKRDWKNQIKRFQLLEYIHPVLKGMSHYQEYFEALENIKIKKHGTSKIESKLVKYWAFVAIIKDKIRIKVILKQIGKGNIHFWSIIPIWKTTEYKNIKTVSLHRGNPKED